MPLTFSQRLIVEEKLNESRILLENICRGLTEEQNTIIKRIHREFLPLIEATLTTDQISQLFKNVEQSATASGSNRTGLGKAVDVAKLPVQAVQKVNDIINKAGQWAQNTKPVQAFDQKFEELKAKISSKFPNLTQNLTQAGEWAKANPGKTAVIIGVLTAVASLAGGPLGGAIAGQILRGTTELMKGEKLSTAIGKGAKAAAVGALAGWSIDKIGDFLGSGLKMVADNLFPGARRLNLSFMVSGTGPSTFQNLRDVIGKPEDLEPIRGAWNQAAEAWRNGQYSQAEALFQQAKDAAAKLADPGYAAQLAQDENARQAIVDGAKSVMAASDALAVAAQGAVTGAVGNQKPTQQSTPESLSFQQIKKIFYTVDRKYLVQEGIADTIKQFGSNLTTKITADKLMKAWKAAGSPTDSNAIADILKNAGVDDSIISSTFQSMNIASTQSSPVSQTSSQPSTKLTVAQINQAIKILRLRDLQSIQKTVNNVLSKRSNQPTTP